MNEDYLDPKNVVKNWIWLFFGCALYAAGMPVPLIVLVLLAIVVVDVLFIDPPDELSER